MTTDLDPDLSDLIAEADLGGDVRVTYEMRYRGQAYELSVEDPEDFPAAHERAYGYRDDDAEVELVTVRVTGTVPGPEIEAAAPAGIPATVTGPAVVDLGESTLVVPPGWSGESDERGTLWMRSSSE